MNSLLRLGKSLQELGPTAVAQNAWYLLLLKSGIYRSLCPRSNLPAITPTGAFQPLPMPDPEILRPYLAEDIERVLREKDEILNGTFHPFYGQQSAPLDFTPVNGSRHWSSGHRVAIPDLKLIWESSRFHWVDMLLRGEALNRNGKAENCFWEKLDDFNRRNPVNLGENWESAQEVGLRLIKIAFAASLFLRYPGTDKNELPSKKREELAQQHLKILSAMVETHAQRILQTLIYARSQRNNHLLSESAALMTAAVVLPDAKDAGLWWERGSELFFSGLDDQIAASGCYIQHSSNYHRLMLQLTLWIDLILRVKGDAWPAELLPKLRASVNFLNAFCDPASGRCSNIGHNDGSLLFRFGTDYGDYRPTLQAASLVFNGKKLYPAGKWDELSCWLSIPSEISEGKEPEPVQSGPLCIETNFARVLMLAEPFRGRPAHDDRLHTELWVRGINEFCDGGTWRYSDPDGHDNMLKYAWTHNTLLIDYREPMSDAGKFLWLDWDKARKTSREARRIAAEHRAYRNSGLSHSREILAIDAGFRITDKVTPREEKQTLVHTYRLHWLLPDQLYTCTGPELLLERLRLRFYCGTPCTLRVIRAGVCVFSSQYPDTPDTQPEDSFCGWISPTYNEKVPALSVVVQTMAQVPFKITTEVGILNPAGV